MFIKPERKWTTYLFFFAYFGAPIFFVLGLGLHAYNRTRFDVEMFDHRIKEVIERSEHMAEKAVDFDQARVLEALGPSPINGPVYRFDDQFLKAHPFDRDGETHSPENPLSGKSVLFNFDETDTHRFDRDRSDFKIENGLLKVNHEKGRILMTSEPIGIAHDETSSVRFRMKLEQGERVEFAFARGLIPKRWRITEPQMGIVTAEVVPDGEFHTYEVNIRDVFQFDEYDGLKNVQRLFFTPSDVDGDHVEIDFIHILHRKARYLEDPVGRSRETLNTETRPVLYMASPMDLTYKVTVPESAPILRFGLGMLEPDDPVTFTVVLETNDESQVLFEETREWQDDWTDAQVRLDAWAGREVSLRFSAVSVDGNIAFWSNPRLSGSAIRPFNVVILLEDTLRADHLSVYGYDRRTSPFKEALAEQSVVFETAFAQATETRPSCPSLMTSMYPTATGVYFFTQQLNERYVTLAEVMRSQGFETGAFVQNNFAGRVAGLHQGYSQFFEGAFDLSGGPQVIYNDRLDSWLDKHSERNFLLYLHLFNPHDPYEPEPPFDAWAKEPSRDHPGKDQEGTELAQSLYDGEILGNDVAFEKFIAGLKERGIFDNTLIVFTSDHGEFFGEHGGILGHRPPAYSQVIHVPLFLHYPKAIPQGRRIHTPVALIDVMPTILDLAGVRTDPLLLQGDSLLPIIRQDKSSPDLQRLVTTDDVRDMELRDPVGWGAVRFGKWHFINSRRYLHPDGDRPTPRIFPQFWSMQIFNYGEDPSEQHQDFLFALDPLLKRHLQGRLIELQSAHTRLREIFTRGEETESSNESEMVQRLRDLGYLN